MRKFAPVKGSRDFYPEEKAVQNWLFEIWTRVSQRFGFAQFEGPILEPIELYEAKSGPEILAQTYQFKDKAGRKLAIRPEMTPTLARMIAARQNSFPTPARWFSIGNFWRYEAPQKGRYRDFWQWNVDILGSVNPLADAEVIATACEFFRSVGLTPAEVVIKISDRKLAETRLDVAGVKQSQVLPVLRTVDKMPKLTRAEFERSLKRAGLTQETISNLRRVLEDLDFGTESDWLTELFTNLADLGVAGWCQFDPTVVRGLDYYTSTVFEAFDTRGEFRAILAGGRYDSLVEDIGGKPLTGVGFGAGDAVIFLVLEKFGKLPKLTTNPTRVLVTVFDESLARDSVKLVNNLRTAGINSEIYPEATKLDKQLKYANKCQIPYVVILGPEESSRKIVTVKVLKTGTQIRVSQEALPELVKKGFENI